MRDEPGQALQRTVQAELRRRPADRADERAHARVGVLQLQPVAPAEHVDGEQAGGVRDLLGEVHREVPQRAAEAFGQAVLVRKRRLARGVAALEHVLELGLVVVGKLGCHRYPPRRAK
jgi:hypothetical protein